MSWKPEGQSHPNTLPPAVPQKFKSRRLQSSGGNGLSIRTKFIVLQLHTHMYTNACLGVKQAPRCLAWVSQQGQPGGHLLSSANGNLGRSLKITIHSAGINLAK